MCNSPIIPVTTGNGPKKDNGAVETMEAKQAIRQAVQIADQRYAEANVEAINNSTLDEETEQVSGLLEAFGVPEDEFTPRFAEILEKVHKDKDNFNKQGLRKNGSVLAACAKEIKKMADGKTTSAIQKKTDEEIATGKLSKVIVRTDAVSRQQFKGPTEKVYKNSQDVVDDLLREYAAKK